MDYDDKREIERKLEMLYGKELSKEDETKLFELLEDFWRDGYNEGREDQSRDYTMMGE